MLGAQTWEFRRRYSLYDPGKDNLFQFWDIWIWKRRKLRRRVVRKGMVVVLFW